MTKKALTILRTHEAIKEGKLKAITDCYKKSSIAKMRITEELEKEIANRYAEDDICKSGIFTYNTHTYTYGAYVVRESTKNPITLHITSKKAVEVIEYTSFYLITEYENWGSKLYYRNCYSIDKPY